MHNAEIIQNLRVFRIQIRTRKFVLKLGYVADIFQVVFDSNVRVFSWKWCIICRLKPPQAISKVYFKLRSSVKDYVKICENLGRSKSATRNTKLHNNSNFILIHLTRSVIVITSDALTQVSNPSVKQKWDTYDTKWICEMAINVVL